jgi:hypothetical protein
MGPGATWINFNVVVECKSGKKIWIAFVDEQDDVYDALEPEAWFAWMPKEISNGDTDNSTDIARHVEKSAIHRGDTPLTSVEQRPAYGMTQLRTSGSERDAAHAAVRQVLSGAFSVVGKVSGWSGDGTKTRGYTAALPVVVTDGPLFRCGLNKNGSIEVIQSDREVLLTKTDDGSRYVAVHIVQESALPRFVNDCRDLVSRLCLPPQSA